MTPVLAFPVEPCEDPPLGSFARPHRQGSSLFAFHPVKSCENTLSPCFRTYLLTSTMSSRSRTIVFDDNYDDREEEFPFSPSPYRPGRRSSTLFSELGLGDRNHWIEESRRQSVAMTARLRHLQSTPTVNNLTEALSRARRAFTGRRSPSPTATATATSRRLPFTEPRGGPTPADLVVDANLVPSAQGGGAPVAAAATPFVVAPTSPSTSTPTTTPTQPGLTTLSGIRRAVLDATQITRELISNVATPHAQVDLNVPSDPTLFFYEDDKGDGAAEAGEPQDGLVLWSNHLASLAAQVGQP